MSLKGSVSGISRRSYDAVIFDLDGVVTQTARVHAAAWKSLFNEYLEERSASEGGSFEPFDIETDYRRYVDGKPRYEGVRSFLESRGIDIPYGTPGDPPDKETICGLGNRKNLLFHKQLEREGVDVFGPAIDLIHLLRSKVFKTAVVSSSKNCSTVLQAARIGDLFDAKVDGLDSEELELAGKPAPDIFIEAARRLGVAPERAVAVEDALAGVQAGSKGGFGCIIGVDRADHERELMENGADIVVKELSEISVHDETCGIQANVDALPSALERLDEIIQRVKKKRVALFLDYDGTLTPIVEHPGDANLSDHMRSTLKLLAEHSTLAVISGRDLRDVRGRAGIDSIFYAGSHGFDIAGPEGRRMENEEAADYLPILDSAEQALRGILGGIGGAYVERKKFSIAVHFRMVKEDETGAVEKAVDEVLIKNPKLRKSYGKKVFELQPDIDWHKGKALLRLLEALNLDQPDTLPLYIGDDVTDEDAFNSIRGRGIGIAVLGGPQCTAAGYTLESPDEVQIFLRSLVSMLKEGKS